MHMSSNLANRAGRRSSKYMARPSRLVFPVLINTVLNNTDCAGAWIGRKASYRGVRGAEREDRVGRSCSEDRARPLHTAFLVASYTECLRMLGAADNGKVQHRDKKNLLKI